MSGRISDLVVRAGIGAWRSLIFLRWGSKGKCSICCVVICSKQDVWSRL